jgi:hypothetical protein
MNDRPPPDRIKAGDYRQLVLDATCQNDFATSPRFIVVVLQLEKRAGSLDGIGFAEG